MYLYVFRTANSNYELGRGDKIGGWKPQPVPSLKDVRLVQIASGGYHSLALTGMIHEESYNCNGFYFTSWISFAIYGVLYQTKEKFYRGVTGDMGN